MVIGNMFAYYFVDPNFGVEIFFKKQRATELGIIH